MKSVITKILTITIIVVMFSVFIFSGMLDTSTDANVKVSNKFSEKILPQ